MSSSPVREPVVGRPSEWQLSGRVIVLGGVNVDLVVSGRTLPGPGETVTGGTFERHDGGKGGNQAVAAARLGASVRMIGAIGDDSFGAGARAALAGAGVDASGLVTVPGAATGIALILVDSAGENLISVASGANWALAPAVVEAELGRLGSLAGDVVLVSCEPPAAVVQAALRVARAAGGRTILNPAPAASLDRATLELVDVLTPNRGELAVLAGDAGEAARDLENAARRLPVGQAVIVTLGAAGALLVPRDSAAVALAAPAVAAVDATGAGDTFNGALAADLAIGIDLESAVRRAVVAGSLATTRPGARDGMPSAAELDAALAG